MDFFIGSMAQRASEFVACTDDAASAQMKRSEGG
jgi:hypothetical protein